MRTAITRYAIRLLIVTTVVTTLAQGVAMPRAQAGGVPSTFNPNLLIEDDSFIAINSMSVDEIQRFLDSKGGALRNFSENGRSAAQIIWDAAHGYDDASGTWNEIIINTQTGTVNPKVLLVTLQKEQGLITNPNPSQRDLDCAMGYEGGRGCSWMFENRPHYKGFANQVEWAAWQLRYNYEASGKDNTWRNQYYPDSSFPYKPMFPGETASVTNTDYPTQNVTFNNQATAALYRYTPHVYYGNHSFWNFFRQWFVRWSAEVVGRNGNQRVARGGSVEMVLLVRNTGEETWQKGIFNLGTERERDRIPTFIREDRQTNQPSGWIRDNRIELEAGPVAPGGVGTFRFWYTAPDWLELGTYREYFRPVADGYEWLNDFELSWDITVTTPADDFRADLVSRTSNITLPQGASSMFEVRFRNTGTTVWRQGTTNLGTERDRDRTPYFIREDVTGGNPSGWIRDNRVGLVESQVNPGDIGTFRFYYTAPDLMPAGTYREYFRPVIDGLSWLPQPDFDLSWDITVTESVASLTKTEWVSQNSNPTLARGQSYQFEVQFRNRGRETWQRTAVKLGTDRQQDRISPFIREDIPGSNPSGWLADNRVQMVEETVAPGSVGTFRFWYTVPNDLAPGTYREYFRPVIEYVAWMQDHGVHWDIVVTP